MRNVKNVVALDEYLPTTVHSGIVNRGAGRSVARWSPSEDDVEGEDMAVSNTAAEKWHHLRAVRWLDAHFARQAAGG